MGGHLCCSADRIAQALHFLQGHCWNAQHGTWMATDNLDPFPAVCRGFAHLEPTETKKQVKWRERIAKLMAKQLCPKKPSNAKNIPNVEEYQMSYIL